MTTVPFPFYEHEYCPTCHQSLLIDRPSMLPLMAKAKRGQLSRSEYTFWCANCHVSVKFTDSIPVQAVDVHWADHHAGPPELLLRVEYWPNWGDFRYSRHDFTIADEYMSLFYLAELAGAVSFYWPAHRNGVEIPGNGFGGRAFHLIMKSGEHHDLLGPGAGEPSYINGLLDIDIVEVNYTTSIGCFNKGIFSMGYITKAIAEEAMAKSNNGFKLVKVWLQDDWPKRMPAYLWRIARPHVKQDEFRTSWSELWKINALIKS